MSPWIKICANTSLADARLAVESGADAVGFVFAPSPRQVTPAQVAAITPNLPDSVEKIGVFVDWEYDAIAGAVEQAVLSGVQLHYSDGQDDLAEKLRVRFGPGLRIQRVIHFGPHAARQLELANADPNINGVLVDSRTATAVGGTGVSFDWHAARATVFSGRGHLKLVAAGGLSPANVGAAIAILRPWGVDVASGVESSPGKKDQRKVSEFVANARAAFEQFHSQGTVT